MNIEHSQAIGSAEARNGTPHDATEWSHVTYLINENRAENDCLLAELLKRWPTVHFRVVLSDNDHYREMIVSDVTWDDHNKNAIYYFVSGFTKGWCEGWIARGNK